MIAQPGLWRCVMEISDNSMAVALRPPVDNEPLIYRNFAFDISAGGKEKSVQEIIYDNPLLLSDFKSIEILLDSESTLPAPRALIEQTGAETLLKSVDAEISGQEVSVSNIDDEIAIVYTSDPKLNGFLRRTFFNLKIEHRFKPLILWRLKNAPTVACVFGAPTAGALDVVVSSNNGALTCVNRFRTDSVNDMAYYMLAARTIACEKLGTEPIVSIYAGANELRDTLMKYGVNPTTTSIPASVAKLGKEATRMSVALTATIAAL